MATVDGVKAVDKFLGWKTYAPGMCLEAVSKALGTYWLTSDKPGYYTYALRGYERTPKSRINTSRKIPKGAVVYFTASGNGFGHICFGIDGTNKVASTDIPRNGQIGVTTVEGIERAWGRKFLGWSDYLMGHDITVGKAGGVVKKSDQEIIAGYLQNADALVKAAKDTGLPLDIAAAVIEKESGGKNIFGHDAGGAYHGGGTVTEAKYKDFIKQVRGGKTSNGVGPAQITWPGFFTEMEKQGLKPWVPYDNMLYGFRLMASYLGGKTTDAAISNAGKRYNGNASYGTHLVEVVKKWRGRLRGTTSTGGSSSSSGVSQNTNLKHGGHKVTNYPFGEYRLKKGDSENDVCNMLGMSKTRFRNLNNRPNGWGKGQWPAGLVVRVAFDYAPQKRRTLRPGSEGYDVAQLQFHLNKFYPAYSKLVVDGILGAATVRVIKEFQRRSDIAADGIVGPATWKKLGTLVTR